VEENLNRELKLNNDVPLRHETSSYYFFFFSYKTGLEALNLFSIDKMAKKRWVAQQKHLTPPHLKKNGS
jgi:hypothetical protein